MKHLYILILALVVGQQGFAQNRNESDAFKKDILSQFGTYFENAEISGDRNINLYATAAYNSLLTGKKNTIIETILSKSTCDFVIVHFQYMSELWKKETNDNRVSLIDTWNMNSPARTSNVKTTQKTNSHPWFFYLGAGGTYSSEIGDINNLNLSSRLGFFLLKNRWDLAVSYTLNIAGNGNYDSPLNSNIGLMTKVYFPIRKINISPYIGTGISYITTSSTSDIFTINSDSWDVPLYMGISWFVGHGSLDIGYLYGNNSGSMVTIGYTFSLWSK